MNSKDLFSVIQEIFDEIFMEPTIVTAELSARQVPEWDSLAQIRLVLALEKKLKIQFQLGQVENAKNLGELVELIEKIQRRENVAQA